MDRGIESKQRVVILGLLSILLIAVWLLVPAPQAEAKTVKMKLRVASYLANLEWSPVGDVEGHIIGFFFEEGPCLF